MQGRVLSICTSAEIGGMERVAVGITRQLARRRWDAELLFGEGPQSGALLAWTAKQGVRATTSPAVLSVLEPRRSWRSTWELARVIRARKPDAVVFHYGGAHISIKDIVAARMAGVRRCIAQVHLPVEWSDAGSRKRQVTRAAAALSSGVVVHSAAVQRVVEEAGVPPGRIHRVNPGVAIPLAAAARDDARDRLGVTPGTFVVGCMARLVAHKGVGDLVAAIEHLPDDVRVVLAGDGPERATLEAQAAQLAPGRVTFLGTLESGQDEFFAALDLFVLPSHREGFGLVLIEASMRGVPVVSTRIGGVEDAVVDGRTGILVPPGDICELAAAISRLRESPTLRRELADAARTRALRDFSEEAMGAAVERVLAHLGVRSGVVSEAVPPPVR